MYTAVSELESRAPSVQLLPDPRGQSVSEVDLSVFDDPVDSAGISPFTILILIVCLLLIAAFIYNIVKRFAVRSRMEEDDDEEDDEEDDE